MAHWDFDGDPFLPTVHEIAMAFPDAWEKWIHGTPTYRSRAMFAVYGALVKNPTPGGPMTRIHHAVLIRPDENERTALEQDSRFFLPAYYGPFGWLALNLDLAPVDWREVAELLDSSYRVASTAKQVAQLDAQGSPAQREW